MVWPLQARCLPIQELYVSAAVESVHRVALAGATLACTEPHGATEYVGTGTFSPGYGVRGARLLHTAPQAVYAPALAPPLEIMDLTQA